MIKNVEGISSLEFNKGLVTRSDFLKGDINASPNTMDVQWQFDASLHKRLGASSMNSTAFVYSTVNNFVLDTNSSLTTNLIAYWKMDEASGQRIDQINAYALTDANNNIPSVTGIRGNAANFSIINSQSLYRIDTSSLFSGSSVFSVSFWVNRNTSNFTEVFFSKRDGDNQFEYQVAVANSSGSERFVFQINSGGSNINSKAFYAQSFGAISTGTWYNIIAWHSNNSHVGISVNMSADTSAYTTGIISTLSSPIIVGYTDTANDVNSGGPSFSNIDEIGFWNKVLSAQERKDLYGGASGNTIIQTKTSPIAGWTLDTNSSLTTSLTSYWKMDEASGTRFDQLSTNPLTDANNNLGSITGKRGQAASYLAASSENLFSTSTSLQTGNINFSVNAWVYLNNLSTQVIAAKRPVINGNAEWQMAYDAAVGNFNFGVSSNGVSITTANGAIIWATSFGSITTGTWYHIIGWHSNNSHIGISVNLSVNTQSYTQGITVGTAPFVVGNFSDGTIGGTQPIKGRIDEVGFWKKVLTASERADLYGGGSGNTFSGSLTTGFSWASFDFGASSIRWLTIAAGTGLYASSNRGTTFVAIGTTRTQNYQYFERSKNVLIATSDAYDPTLYWAGSAGTFAATLAPNSAPAAKFSINYQGFLNLLNFQDSNGTLRKRGFAYQDENTQIAGSWSNSFDLPSSADDEITGSFILYKFLYVSTRYRIFRLAYVGGNPDWSFLQIKTWGFVPRTVQVCTLQNGGQVAIGMDWDRRLRMFDGFDDHIISDNVENNNGLCEFALQNISYAGSGLVVSHGIYNPLQQEYRLNVALGNGTTQTTHALVLNLRSLAMYPYQNQQWQTMCIAESNNQRALMAADRSGFVYILDSGNLDKGVTPINDVYDTPPLFSNLPEKVGKGKNLNLFFQPASCGTIYLQDRIDLSNQWSPMIPLSDRNGNTQITGQENAIKVLRTYDIKATYNTWQGRITSSSGTANPWQLDRLDFLQQGFGIGIGH